MGNTLPMASLVGTLASQFPLEIAVNRTLLLTLIWSFSAAACTNTTAENEAELLCEDVSELFEACGMELDFDACLADPALADSLIGLNCQELEDIAGSSDSQAAGLFNLQSWEDVNWSESGFDHRESVDVDNTTLVLRCTEGSLWILASAAATEAAVVSGGLAVVTSPTGVGAVTFGSGAVALGSLAGFFFYMAIDGMEACVDGLLGWAEWAGGQIYAQVREWVARFARPRHQNRNLQGCRVNLDGRRGSNGQSCATLGCPDYVLGCGITRADCHANALLSSLGSGHRCWNCYNHTQFPSNQVICR